MLDVWVGHLSDGSDPLDWGGEYRIGNTPGEALTPIFPSTGTSQPWGIVIDKIKSGQLCGKQVDWGAWAANVTKQEILDFLSEVYGGHEWFKDESPTSYASKRLKELRTTVEALPDGRYALIADEF